MQLKITQNEEDQRATSGFARAGGEVQFASAVRFPPPALAKPLGRCMQGVESVVEKVTCAEKVVQSEKAVYRECFGFFRENVVQLK